MRARVTVLPSSLCLRKYSLGDDHCFFFSFGITATGWVGVRALDLELLLRYLSDWLSPPSSFSAIFSQSGMTIALINSCTVMSLSSAIFRSFV